ncbi:ATP-binding protein [Acidobacteriota bacterium]
MNIKQRGYWENLIEESWKKRSLLWLSGVRRVGKTCLCQSLLEIEYFDCELPRHRREMNDPELFLEKHKNKRIVLDEIHRLKNPTELLKIASDHYQNTKVLATGSSTLGASSRFKDTLAGRKFEIWLTPLISFDLKDFKMEDLTHRLYRGGLPPFFLDKNYPDRQFQEWMDSFWAKDIQELFRLEKRFSFQRFTELLFMQSGGIFEATKFSSPCEISRTTVNNYLSVLESTFVVHIIRPFSSRRTSEIVSAPKVYAFDTGFVSFYKGWQELRPEDIGILWEHYVLNEIIGRLQRRDIRYWRDKRHHEVDFVTQKKGKTLMAIECKISADHFDETGLKAFRRIYPDGKNLVVTRDVTRSFSRRYDEMLVEFVSLDQLISYLE